jgi:hypothetical protein
MTCSQIGPTAANANTGTVEQSPANLLFREEMIKEAREIIAKKRAGRNGGADPEGSGAGHRSQVLMFVCSPLPLDGVQIQTDQQNAKHLPKTFDAGLKISSAVYDTTGVYAIGDYSVGMGYS